MSEYSGLAEINGRPLFVEIDGDSSKPLLIAMHGLGGSTNTFPIATDLSEHFRVVRWDYEGSGKSPLTPGMKCTMEGLVEDLIAIIDFAAPKPGAKAFIFGHSGGAAIGQWTAVKYPERIEKLILSCPGLPRKGIPESEKMSFNLADVLRKNGTFTTADSAANRNLGPNATRSMKALYRASWQGATAEGMAQILDMLGNTGAPEYEKITCPTLVLAASQDGIVGKQAEQVPALLVETKADLKMLDCGHVPAVEKSEEVISIIKDFFLQ